MARGQVPSNAEWHRVQPFENVDAARIRYLTVAEAKRLINAAIPSSARWSGCSPHRSAYSELRLQSTISTPTPARRNPAIQIRQAASCRLDR